MEVEYPFPGVVEDHNGMLDIPATVAYIGNYLRRSFPMVERDDILQEMFAWVYGHPDKVEQWLAEGEHGTNRLHKALRHAGLRYCQEEKARVLGYKVEDLYYYELGFIRDSLTRIWDEEAWTNPPQPLEQAKVKHRSVSEGNNYIATLSDVSRAVDMLAEHEQLLLKWFYNDGYTTGEIGEHLDITKAAVESRLNRLVRKLQRLLGGERPQVRQ